MARTRVKICCISSLEEAQFAISCGADALGLVSHMPSGPGVIGEPLIGDIARAAPPAIGTFLLTSALAADEIIAQQERCHVNTVQIVDALPHGEYAKLSKAMPGVALVQVIMYAVNNLLPRRAQWRAMCLQCCSIQVTRRDL